MNDNNIKYRMLKNSYLSKALSFLNINFYKFNDKDTGEVVYSFEDTEKFRFALDSLYNLREEINKKFD